MRCPNRGSCGHQPSAVPSGGSVSVGGGARWDAEMWSSDKWWNVMWCADKCWYVVPAMWVTRHIALIVPCVLTIKLEFRAYISLCRCYDYKMNVVVTTGFASHRLLRTCITSLTSHITSLTSYCDFSRQGQHLVMLEWHFSWKVQYLVTRASRGRKFPPSKKPRKHSDARAADMARHRT